MLKWLLYIEKERLMAKKKKEIVKDSHMLHVGIEEVMTESFGTYAKYVNQERSIPDLRDGLLPVQRRLLFAMYDAGFTSNKKYVKSARPVSEAMGKYHPHGDSSIYGAMARMSKKWVVNEQLVDMDGNNGSIDGDGAAAMRYTESRLAPYSEDLLLSSLSLKGIVDMKNNFDDTLQEPEYLPAKVPNVLINGSEGIAVGYASNIPTFNMAETLKGCIAQLKKPNISAKEMMTHVPAPDFPTGGVISGYRGYADILETGRGTYKVRGKYHIEEDTKTYTIVFTEIPYGALKPKIAKVIEEAIYNKKLAGVQEVLDESGRDGLRFTIVCDKKADKNSILGFLFTKTDLQKNVPVNMTVISKQRPRQIGIVDIIKDFNDFKFETFVRGLKIQIENLKKKQHLSEGFIILADNIEEVVSIIKNSDNKSDARTRLLEALPFSEVQVESILSMALHRISKTDRQKHVDTVKECADGITARETVLADDKLIVKQIIKGYRKIIKEQGTPRKTELIEEIENWSFSVSDVIPEENVVVGIMKGGMVKRSSLRSYGSTENVDTDDLISEVETTTRKHVMMFTNNGKYIYVPVHKLPDLRWGDGGKHINTLGSDLGANEFIYACEFDEEASNMEDLHVVIVKNNGKIKVSQAKDYIRTRGHFTFMDSVKVSKDEEVIKVFLVDLKEKNYITFVDNMGYHMYFELEEMSVTGVKTGGSKGIALNGKKNKYVREVGLYHTEEDIPEGIDYRSRGSAGWKVKH